MAVRADGLDADPPTQDITAPPAGAPGPATTLLRLPLRWDGCLVQRTTRLAAFCPPAPPLLPTAVSDVFLWRATTLWAGATGGITLCRCGNCAARACLQRRGGRADGCSSLIFSDGCVVPSSDDPAGGAGGGRGWLWFMDGTGGRADGRRFSSAWRRWV